MQYITQRYDGKGNLISETRVDLTPEDIAREWEGIRQERNRPVHRAGKILLTNLKFVFSILLVILFFIRLDFTL